MMCISQQRESANSVDSKTETYAALTHVRDECDVHAESKLKENSISNVQEAELFVHFGSEYEACLTSRIGLDAYRYRWTQQGIDTLHAYGEMERHGNPSLGDELTELAVCSICESGYSPGELVANGFLEEQCSGPHWTNVVFEPWNLKTPLLPIREGTYEIDEVDKAKSLGDQMDLVQTVHSKISFLGFSDSLAERKHVSANRHLPKTAAIDRKVDLDELVDLDRSNCSGELIELDGDASTSCESCSESESEVSEGTGPRLVDL
jgi:hypothetical protein